MVIPQALVLTEPKSVLLCLVLAVGALLVGRFITGLCGCLVFAAVLLLGLYLVTLLGLACLTFVLLALGLLALLGLACLAFVLLALGLLALVTLSSLAFLLLGSLSLAIITLLVNGLSAGLSILVSLAFMLGLSNHLRPVNTGRNISSRGIL